MKSPVQTFDILFAWLAAFWSYSVNHSIWWAIFHFLCGPAYLAYRIVFHTDILK